MVGGVGVNTDILPSLKRTGPYTKSCCGYPRATNNHPLKGIRPTNLVIRRKLFTSCNTELHCFSSHFVIHVRILKKKTYLTQVEGLVLIFIITGAALLILFKLNFNLRELGDNCEAVCNHILQFPGLHLLLDSLP